MKAVTAFLFLVVVCVNSVIAQTPNHNGFTYFTKYEDRLISEETLQKHTFSIGTGLSGYTSEVSLPIREADYGELGDIVPTFRIGVGYHFIFLKKKKLTIFSKNRLEFSGFSVYLNAYNNYLNEELYTPTQSISDSLPRLTKNQLITPQAELRVTYTNPTISYRGKAINFYFLHEFGLSFFREMPVDWLQRNELQTNVFANIVPLSIKFGRRPIFLKSSFNLAFGNNLLKAQKIKGTAGFELQIYFFKTKK